MKRDMDLVREILLQVEASSQVGGWIDLELKGHPPEEVAYHVMILSEADLIRAYDVSTLGEFCWKPSSLTWHGHEFLDASRNDTVWKKTMDFVKEKGGSVPFEVLQALVIRFTAAYFGIT
jgi:hypothetical protein